MQAHLISVSRWQPLLLALILATFSSAQPNVAEASQDDEGSYVRTWTDIFGNTLQAEFAGVQGDNVLLKINGNPPQPFPRNGFRAADRQWISEHANDVIPQNPSGGSGGQPSTGEPPSSGVPGNPGSSPGFPGGRPGMPGRPGFPGGSGRPGMPSMPSIPSMPGMPSTPGAPSMPNFPSPPGFPGGTSEPPNSGSMGAPGFRGGQPGMNPPSGFNEPPNMNPGSSFPDSQGFGPGQSFGGPPEMTDSGAGFEPPSFDPPTPPSFEPPSFDPPSIPTFEYVFQCDNCGKEFDSSSGLKEGDSCPNCSGGGSSFRLPRGSMRGLLTLFLLVGSGVAWAVKKMTGNA